MAAEKEKRPWTPPSVRLLVLSAVYFIVANFFDAWTTIIMVGSGAAEELNPFMKWALDRGPHFFLAWKMGIAAICALLVLFFARKYRVIWLELSALNILYTVVVVHHIYGMTTVGLSLF